MQFRLPTFGPAHMVFTVAIVLVALFCYALVQTAAQAHRLRTYERTLVAEVQELRQQRAELEGLLTYLKSDEYVEAFARQQFGLVKPGEVLVQVDGPVAPLPARRPGEKWWEALFGLTEARPSAAPGPAR
jgi:cell division protein FtsB